MIDRSDLPSRHRYPFAPLAAAMGMTEHAAARTLGLSGTVRMPSDPNPFPRFHLFRRSPR